MQHCQGRVLLVPHCHAGTVRAQLLGEGPGKGTPVPVSPAALAAPAPRCARTRHALGFLVAFQARPGHPLGMAQKINSSSDLRNFMTRV